MNFYSNNKLDDSNYERDETYSKNELNWIEDDGKTNYFPEMVGEMSDDEEEDDEEKGGEKDEMDSKDNDGEKEKKPKRTREKIDTSKLKTFAGADECILFIVIINEYSIQFTFEI